jgi:hypothetical protein
LHVLVGRAPVVTGRGDEKAAADRQRLRLRASHADRERVIEVLKAAFVQGRLTKAELDTRIGQAFTSKTFADLAGLTADLPASPPAAPQPPAQANVRAAVSVAVAAMAITVALWAAAFVTDGALARLAALATVMDFLALMIAGAQVLDSRHQKRSARRGPGPDRPGALSR